MTERDRRTVVVGGALLLVAVVFRFGLLPAWDAWTSAQDAVGGHRTRIDDLSMQIKRLETVENRLRQKLGPAVAAPAMTVEAARVLFPKAVQEALNKGGAGVSSIELQQVRRLRDAAGWSLVSVRVQATCKGDRIPKVLNSFRGSQQLILVDRMGLDMARKGDRENWKLEMILSTPVVEGGAL